MCGIFPRGISVSAFYCGSFRVEHSLNLDTVINQKILGRIEIMHYPMK